MANRQPSGKSGGGWTRTTERRLSGQRRSRSGSKTSIDLLPLLHAPVHFAPAAIKTESADSGGAKERR